MKRFDSVAGDQLLCHHIDVPPYSSAVERHLDKVGVRGSNPRAGTKTTKQMLGSSSG